MKILYHHRTLADGAEGIHIAEMVNAFRQLGHEVLLIGPGVARKGDSEARSNKFKWVKKIFKGPFYEMVEIAYNFTGYRSISKAIEEFKPDLIYDRYITFNYSVIAASRKYGIPIFLEVNAPLAFERDHEPDESLYFKKIAYYIERKVCCDASRVIVVSSPLKKYLISINVPETQISVLPNGVNTDTFFPRGKSRNLMERLSLREDDLVVGFVGILRPWHGLDNLLDAFSLICREFENCKLLIVGDGPIKGEIERKICQLGISDMVRIAGRVAHAEVSDYISIFDIAVSPKATFYASPMKIIEYMAQKKVVLAPDMENIRDLITDRVNGVLFQPEKINSLSESLRVLVSDSELRERMGQNALLSVKQRFNWKNNARFVLEKFQGET